MIKAAVLGATGYTGRELVRILSGHPDIKALYLYAAPKRQKVYIEDVFPEFNGRISIPCTGFSFQNLPRGLDAAFLAVPHTVSMDIARGFIKKGVRVIDLSADFRLSSAVTYRRLYGKTHTQRSLLKEAAYGIPELNASAVKKACLVANPGCFPTSVILGLAPVAKDITGPVYIDSKTGTSGAGKKVSPGFIFTECAENIRPYKVLGHRHQPEIEQGLSAVAGKEIKTYFVPHLAPMKRGILSTIFLRLKKSISTSSALNIYRRFYKDAPFIHILPKDVFPEVKHTVLTNMCRIGIKSAGTDIVVISAIDNLIKGAAGQAVQNMNIMFGIPEETGLK